MVGKNLSESSMKTSNGRTGRQWNAMDGWRKVYLVSYQAIANYQLLRIYEVDVFPIFVWLW